MKKMTAKEKRRIRRQIGRQNRRAAMSLETRKSRGRMLRAQTGLHSKAV